VETPFTIAWNTHEGREGRYPGAIRVESMCRNSEPKACIVDP
jgi:hypothetical protein